MSQSLSLARKSPFSSSSVIHKCSGGIRMACSSMLCENLFCNPEGIESLSPGLSRFPEGLPWVEAFTFHNPERVEYHTFMKEIQPLQGCDFAEFSPRVARCSQPWAERFNPVGIGKTSGNRPNMNSAFHRKQRRTILRFFAHFGGGRLRCKYFADNRL